MKNKIIIYPTDTVWGIGASIDNLELHNQIHAIKGTSYDKPVSIMLDTVERFKRWVDLDEQILSLDTAESLFNFEVTLGIELNLLKVNIPNHITCNSNIVGLRVSSNLEVSKMIGAIGGAITSTSLNLSGESPIIDFENARRFYEDKKENNPEVELFVPSSPYKLSGNSSTFIKFNQSGFSILREGKYHQQISSKLKL